MDSKVPYAYLTHHCFQVCIVPGGRAGLTRVAAAIGDINVGYFLPEVSVYGMPFVTSIG